MIKNLIFDFGKVLVDYDFEAFFKKYIPDINRCKAFTPVLYNEDIQRLLDREAKPFDEIMEEIIGLNPCFEQEIRMFNEHYTDIVTEEVNGMRELLTRLKEEGYKLYGLTNWCSKVYQTIEKYEIFKLLDGYIISSEEKVIKPEAEIYQRLFSKFNLNPSECIFTDDKEENIIGGEHLGMKGIVFKNAVQYEKELRRMISEVNDDMSWEVLESEYLYKRPWLTAKREHVKLPTGAEIKDFYVLEYPDFCNVIAITQEGKFLLERQYRHAQHYTGYEIPAGCVEVGEDPMEAAKRELYEETGFGGGEWSHFMTISPNAGACTNYSHTYLAVGVEQLSNQHLEESEDIKIILMESEEVFRMLKNDEFHQAMMAAPLWKYFSMNKPENDK